MPPRPAPRQRAERHQRREPPTAAPLRPRAGWLAVATLVAGAGLLAFWLHQRPEGGPVRAGQAPPVAPPPAAPPRPARQPLRLGLRVRASHPHDAAAYTQGLVWHAGHLYESAGQYRASTLREVELASGRVLRRLELPPSVFGEGLALVPGPDGDRLVQLTWREGVAFAWDPATFAARGRFEYRGEGWGLCDDGRQLVMSDGSATLTLRDRTTFAVLSTLRVTAAGAPVANLNELECVDGVVYANVWQTDTIVRIDPESGEVDATIDASGLLSATERATAEVLNGIAWVPERGVFLVTGKYWPKLFEVELVEPSAR
jgi:glutaminyl-peptide cyclotransferase